MLTLNALTVTAPLLKDFPYVEVEPAFETRTTYAAAVDLTL